MTPESSNAKVRRATPSAMTADTLCSPIVSVAGSVLLWNRLTSHSDASRT